MIEADVAELISYFLSCFGIGFVFGFILRVFRRASDLVR